MVLIVQALIPELEELCRLYGVLRLEVFGSAFTSRYIPGESDMDFLVEFHPFNAGGYADAYFGLLEGLVGAPVDLVVDSAIKNPYFRESVQRGKTLIYAA